MKLGGFHEMYDRTLDLSQIREKKLDLRYGENPAEKLDIYSPESGTPPYSVIVFFHGGGFFKGDKSRYQLYPALQGIYNGYAVVSANYRMLPEFTLPAAFEDAISVIEYLKNNSTQLNIDKEKISVWGESAGAALACYAGMKCQLKAIIDWYSPMRMDQISSSILEEAGSDAKDFAEFVYGNDAVRKNKTYDLRNYIDKDVPPVFIQHGTADQLVSPEASEEFYEKLKDHLPEEDLVYIEVENGRHGVEDYQDEKNLEKVFSFLNKYIK